MAGCAPLDSQRGSLLAVVFFFLISPVAAEDDRGNRIVVIVGVGVAVFLIKLTICIVRLNRSSSDDDGVHVIEISHTRDQYVLLVEKAFERTSQQAIHRESQIAPPSIPSGRYKGSRETLQGRMDVEYDLAFDANGSLEGTTIVLERSMHVQGWYNPTKGEFEWAEGNHPHIRNSEVCESYSGELARISNPGYSGILLHTEASMRVVEGSTGVVALIGEYISSDGSQGDLRLIFQPAPLFAPGPDSPDDLCIEMPPLALQKSESMETKMSKLEPTLEKEAL